MCCALQSSHALNRTQPRHANGNSESLVLTALMFNRGHAELDASILLLPIHLCFSASSHSTNTHPQRMSALIKRIMQSIQLARMGLRINRAEVQRASKLQQASAARLQKIGAAQGGAGSGANLANLTPEQMQQRIKELRAALAASQSQAFAADASKSSAAVSSSSLTPQQMQDAMASNFVEGTAAADASAAASSGSATAAASSSASAAAAASARESEADLAAARALAAFHARLDALTDREADSFARSQLHARSLEAIASAEGFGDVAAKFGSGGGAKQQQPAAATEAEATPTDESKR